MTKFEKACAYINHKAGAPIAHVHGFNSDEVYVLTDAGELRLHPVEVDCMSANFDLDPIS